MNKRKEQYYSSHQRHNSQYDMAMRIGHDIEDDPYARYLGKLG